MLERFRAAQAPAVERLVQLERRGALPGPYAGPRPSLAGALAARGPGALIAEYKRASPSRGDINLTLEPEDAARAYAEAGATALSVLTEQVWFKGHISYLDRMATAGLPLLRKDFLIHPLQVRETAATPASALLLIVRMLDDAMLAAMLADARSAGLEAVLEVFDRKDLDRARAALDASGPNASGPAGAGPAIIQVNNRDLDTLRVDASTSRTLIALKRAGEVWISASGASRPEDVAERAALGFEGVLVGTALMDGPDQKEALARLAAGQAGDPATRPSRVKVRP